MLQVLLRITEAVMKRPQDNQRKDSFAESLASLLFRVWLHLVCYTLSDKQAVIEMDLSSPLFFGSVRFVFICTCAIKPALYLTCLCLTVCVTWC